MVRDDQPFDLPMYHTVITKKYLIINFSEDSRSLNVKVSKMSVIKPVHSLTQRELFFYSHLNFTFA